MLSVIYCHAECHLLSCWVSFIVMLSVIYCHAECHFLLIFLVSLIYCYYECHLFIVILSVTYLLLCWVSIFHCYSKCHLFIVSLSVTFSLLFWVSFIVMLSVILHWYSLCLLFIVYAVCQFFIVVMSVIYCYTEIGDVSFSPFIQFFFIFALFSVYFPFCHLVQLMIIRPYSFTTRNRTKCKKTFFNSG